MHAAVRPYVTAAVRPYITGGVALVGAGAIALSPIAAPLPEIHLPNPARVAASVELAAAAMAATPITLAQVFQEAVTNAQSILATAAADPAPILTKIISNQIASVQALLALLPTTAAGPANGTMTTAPASPTSILSSIITSQQALLSALGTTGGQLATALTTVPPILQSAVGDLTSLNVEGAINNLLLAGLTAAFPLTGIVTPAVDTITEPLQSVVNLINNLGPLGTIVSNPLQNVVNVLNAVTNGGALSPLGNALVGALGPVINGASAFGAAVDNVVNSIGTGPAGVVGALLNGPAVILSGMLNGGFGPSLGGLVGIPATILAGGLLNQLSFPPGTEDELVDTGTIPALQALVQAIAAALTPPPIAAAMATSPNALVKVAAVKAPSALPSATPNLVAVSTTAATVKARAAASAPVVKLVSSPDTKASMATRSTAATKATKAPTAAHSHNGGMHAGHK